ATKTSSLSLDPSKDGGSHPAHGSLQSALLLATMRAGLLLVLPVSDGLFHSLSHGRMPGLLDLLFHLGEIGGCRDLDGERYLDLHESSPSVIESRFFAFHSRSFSLVLQPWLLGGTWANRMKTVLFSCYTQSS